MNDSSCPGRHSDAVTCAFCAPPSSVIEHQRRPWEERQIALPHIAADDDFAATMVECDRLLTIKGHDYTQGEALKSAHGRLRNFYRNGERLGLPARKVLAVYMTKHLDAIETFLKAGAVESEPIEGRICDAINYLLLLAKMVRLEKRDEEADAAKAVRE